MAFFDDPRCEEALDLLESKRLSDHGWPCEKKIYTIAGGRQVSRLSYADWGGQITRKMNELVKVSAGATMADMDIETQKFNLATTGGIVSETGVAGLTLGGGLGYLARKHGLTLDNLLSAEIITADGNILEASEKENDDLFWAIRGGGGNFGIVRSFEYQLHDVGPKVLTAQVFYPIQMAEKVLKTYRDLMSDAPDELSCYVIAANIPPEEPFPSEYHGKTAIAIVACYLGDTETGMPLVTPLTELGEPIFQAVAPMPYTTLQQSFDAGVPKGQRYYWKSNYFDEISDDAIEVFIKYTRQLPGPLSLVGFEPMGGAIGRKDSSQTAFPYRDSAYSLGIWAGWTEVSDDDRNISWTREFYREMAPHSNGGVYTNYLDSDDGDRIKAAFAEHYERLEKIKAKYDPDNFFKLN